jgi:molecular chaperone DnaK
VMTKLVERNTTIPVRRSEIFSTAEDNQSSVDVHVLQGERPMARDNKSLGNFRLEGIMPAPRGVPKIEVTFDIDANGILNVSAKDQATGKEQKITISNTSNLSEAEIERMVKEAEAHRSEDEKLKQQVEQKNQADNLCHSAEKMLKDLGDKISESEKAPIKQQIDDLRAAIQANDADKIKTLSESLQQALYAISTKAYEQAASTSAGSESANGASGGSDEEIIDAEFRPSDEGVGANK